MSISKNEISEDMSESATAPLIGQTERHLCSPEEVELLGVRVHRDVVLPFLQLQNKHL